MPAGGLSRVYSFICCGDKVLPRLPFIYDSILKWGVAEYVTQLGFVIWACFHGFRERSF